MATTDLPELRLDQLKALTHPLRIRILKELRTNGPATATLLGARLGESSGSTSYHLRQLAKHGFAEEAADVGDGRDRWWRAGFAGHYVEPVKFLDDPAQRAVLVEYEAGIVAHYASTMSEWIAGQHDWPRAWGEAADMSDFRLRLTPARLNAFNKAVHALVETFAEHPSKGGEEVVVLYASFPRRAAPYVEES